MDDEQKKKSKQFDEALPLPMEPAAPSATPSSDRPVSGPSTGAAIELIRKKIQQAYKNEPPAKIELTEISGQSAKSPRSKHQQFIYELTESGKSLKEIQQAWHEYYAGLTDSEKHEVWQEFYRAHAEASQYAKAVEKSPIDDKPVITIPSHLLHPKKSPVQKRVQAKTVRTFPAPKRVVAKKHLHSLLFGLSMGLLVMLVFLFSFFNERFIAPLIQPSRNVSNIPLISQSAAVSPNPQIIIPKINVQIPVVYGVNTIDDAVVEKALENGVVHYADTARPGQDGNAVIVGHSSNNIFNPGKYKFAFVLLSRLDKGDVFYLEKDGKRYTYQVYKKDIVDPTNVSVLNGDGTKSATATLITCDPPGTSIHRLVVVGEQIDPSPSSNTQKAAPSKLAASTKIIPGNSPSLWSRLWGWLDR